MKLKIYTLLIFVLICAVNAHAQSLNAQTDEISWQINGMNDVAANVNVSYECKFITHGSQGVDWIQDNGNFVIHFSTTNIVGNWTNLSEQGSVTFNISGDGLTGTLAILKSATNLTAHLQLQGGTYEINHIYPIQSYEKL